MFAAVEVPRAQRWTRRPPCFWGICRASVVSAAEVHVLSQGCHYPYEGCPSDLGAILNKSEWKLVIIFPAPKYHAEHPSYKRVIPKACRGTGVSAVGTVSPSDQLWASLSGPPAQGQQVVSPGPQGAWKEMMAWLPLELRDISLWSKAALILQLVSCSQSKKILPCLSHVSLCW